jgi:hypothetical protein
VDWGSSTNKLDACIGAMRSFHRTNIGFFNILDTFVVLYHCVLHIFFLLSLDGLSFVA